MPSRHACFRGDRRSRHLFECGRFLRGWWQWGEGGEGGSREVPVIQVAAANVSDLRVLGLGVLDHRVWDRVIGEVVCSRAEVVHMR